MYDFHKLRHNIKKRLPISKNCVVHLNSVQISYDRYNTPFSCLGVSSKVQQRKNRQAFDIRLENVRSDWSY